MKRVLPFLFFLLASLGAVVPSEGALIFGRRLTFGSHAPMLLRTNISVSAGSDQAVTNLTFQLVGTASKGTQVNWIKLPGGSATIHTPNQLSTLVTAGAAGTFVFRLRATDGLNFSQDDVQVVVTIVGPPPNTPPTVTTIPTQSVNEDGTVGPIAFTLGDDATAPGALTVLAVSSNPTLVPNANVTLGGSGASRTVTVVPVANRSGQTTITISITDGGSPALTTTLAFAVNVAPVNDFPTITQIVSPQSTPEDTTKGPLIFTVNDAETSPAALVLSAASSNTNVVANGSASLLLSNQFGSATITIVPRPNQFGTTLISITVFDGQLSFGMTFTLNITPVNDAPVISSIPNILTTNGVAGSANFTIRDVDVEDPPQGLILTATTSNAGVLPVGNIIFSGTPGSTNRTVTVTPIASGSAVVGVTLTDGSGATASTSFTVTAGTSANTPPTIFAPFDQVISEDEALPAVTFAISDSETALSLLTVTAISSNPALVPSGGIVLGGTDGNRTIAITPAANQSGSATISLTVTDSGGLDDTAAFVLTINPVNDSPQISQSGSQSTPEDVAKVVNFSVDDQETAAGSLTLAKSSSNQTLVPDANIVFGGSGANRTATITPGLNQNGSCTILIIVSDGSLTATNTITFVVGAVNDPPTLSAIANQTVNEDTPTSALAFTVGDLETPAASLTLGKNSSDVAKIPLANIVFGGSGANRTVAVTPAANQNGGPVTITYSTSDGTNTTSGTFTVTITAINDAPTITSIGAQTIPRDSFVSVNVTVGDNESGAGPLILSSTSSNPGLLPTANITYSGSGSTRTVTFTPVAGQVGTSTVTIIVSDGTTTTATPSFVVTVTNPVNTPPTISDIANLTISKNGSTGPLAFTISDAQTPAANLVLSVTSSNPSLIPITGGSGDGTVPVAYVSNSGNDSWDGTTPDPVSGTTGPFATLGQARTRVRALKAAGQIPGTGARVVIRGGIYYLSASFDLTSQDSGLSSSAPIVWANSPGEVVQIVGGKEVTGWAAVSGAVLSRLNPTQEAAIKQASLSALGITLGSFNPYGRFAGVITVPIQPAELSFQGLPLTVARFPNQTTATDGSKFALTTSPTSANTFTYTGTRPNGWAETVSNIRVGGWFGNDFSDNTINVTGLNTGSKLVTLGTSTGYPIDTGDRYYFENVLEELDQAGEYYIDSSTSIAYVWPTAVIGGANKVFASQLTTQIISVTSASDIRFDGLIIESSRFRGVQITGGTRVVLRNCTVRNTGAEAVNINSTSRFSGLEYCEVSGTGGSGVVLDGGIRTSLTRGDNYVSNSRINNFSRLVKAYVPGIEPRGVGQLISHNVISNAPGPAIYLMGNDHVMEFNHIHHVCLEAGDLGAYYQWGDPTERGNIIRYNFITDVTVLNGADPGLPVHGLYMDGSSCGMFAYGNILHRMFNPILNNGGRDNHWSNNVLGEITLPNWQRIWMTDPSNPVEWSGYLNAMPYQSAPWTKYQHLSNITGDEPESPKYNVITRNIKHGQGNFVYYEPGVGTSPPYTTETQNYTGGSPGFVNYSLGANLATDFDLTAGSPAWALGWSRIPSELIGILPQPPSGGGGGITFGGSGSSRTITATPVTGQTGSSTVTVTVTDGSGSTASDAFTVTVSDAANQPPTISGLQNQNTTEDVVKVFSFTVADDTTPPANIVVTAISSNPALVPNGNIAIAVSGGTRTVTVTPAANQFGSTTLTFNASDGSASSVASISLVVSSANDSPTISAISGQTTTVNTPITVTGITVGDVETAVGSLTLTATSGNTTLVPNANLVPGGSGASRTLQITPASGQSGSSQITVVVSDGTGGTGSSVFNFVVTVSGGRTFYASMSGLSGNDGLTTSTPWHVNNVINTSTKGLISGDTVWLLPGTFIGQMTLSGGPASGQVIYRGQNRPYTSQAFVVDVNAENQDPLSCVRFSGQNQWLWGVELKNSFPRSQVLPNDSNRPGSIAGDAGRGNKLINSLCHDGGTGIGVQDQTEAVPGDFEVNGCTVYYSGFTESDDPSGHNMYVQKKGTGKLTIKDTVSHNSWNYGIQFQGTELAHLRNLYLDGFICRNAVTLIGFGNDLNNINVDNCWFWSPGSQVLRLRTTSTNAATVNAPSAYGTNCIVRGNWIDGIIWWQNWKDITITNNTFIGGSGPAVDHATHYYTVNNVENRNTIYSTSGSPYRLNGVQRTPAEWQSMTGNGVNDTIINSSGPGATTSWVRISSYDPAEAWLIVANRSGASSATVNLSSFLAANQQFQAYWDGNPKVVHTSGSAVNPSAVIIPMTGTMAAIVGPIAITPQTSLPAFGAFRIVKN